jgi:hypothetical protein
MVDWLGGAGAVGGTLAGSPGAFFNWMANKKQEEAAGEAAAKQDALLQEALARQQAQQGEARKILNTQGMAGGQYLRDYTGQALDEYGRGQASQLSALQGGASGALGSLYSGQSQAASAMQGGVGNALRSLYGGTGQATGALQSGMSGYEQALGQGTGMAANAIRGGTENSRLAQMWSPEFEQDPGYQFRKQQGEEAIMNAASAAGNRGGARTAKALADYNQGLASQAYGDWANRQAMVGGQLDAAQQAAASQLGQLYSGYGQNLGAQRANLGANLANLYTGAGTQAAGLQAGLGQNLGVLYSGTGAQAADVYGGLGAQQADVYGQTATQRAGALGGLGVNLSNLYAGNAAQQANILTGGSAADTALMQAMGQAYMSPVQYSGQSLAAAGQGLERGVENAGRIVGYINPLGK